MEEVQMAQSSWIGNWKERIYTAANQLGFESLEELSKAFPTFTYSEIVERLNVSAAPIQIRNLMKQEANANAGLNVFARDCLVRYFRQMIPKGWGSSSEFDRLHAHVAWAGAFEEKYDKEVLEIGQKIKHLVGVPDNWLPESYIDPFIEVLFKDVVFD